MLRRGERVPRPGARRGDWLRAGWWGRFLRALREQAFASSHGRFVDAGYRALLEREPDADGRRHYVRGLRTGGTTREGVIRRLGESAEAARTTLERAGIQDHVRHFVDLADAVPPGLPPVCFLHTMKCGGTALTHGLSALADPWPRLVEVWVDQLVCMPRPLLERTMLVTGHLPYPAIELLPPATVVLTVVRDPVQRTLSHFAHLRTHGGRPDLTIAEFIGADSWRPAWVNYQARQLASDVPVGEAWLGRFPEAVPLQVLIDAPFTIDEAELAERATKRLAAIEVVGVAEDLDAVLQRVAELWEKPAPALFRENESLAPVRAADLSDSLVDEIRRGTAVDAQLYELARAR